MKMLRTFIRAICVAAICLAATGARAQSGFTNLHSFNVTNGGTEGGVPYGRLVQSGATFFGTTHDGGTGGPYGGTVYKINIDGTGFSNLYDFGPESAPVAGLVLAGSELYGVTQNGGSIASIFVINTNGTGFTNLLSLVGTPQGDLVFAGGTLYGTTYNGSTVFSFNTLSLAFSNIYVFSTPGEGPGSPRANTNTDGSAPSGGLVLSGGLLYGTATAGGTGANGTVFKVNTAGSNFMTLHSFSFTSNDPFLGNSGLSTNSDGAVPYGTLVLSGSTLFGTTSSGGANGTGTVFSINTDGSDFTVLHTFGAESFSTAPVSDALTNADGANPHGGLILSGSTLYGTAYSGGDLGSGTVFQLNTNGSGFTTLYNFSGGLDGGDPYAGLLLSGGRLYGTSEAGGANGWGTVFAVNPSPALVTLNVQFVANSVVLSWSNASFFLQAASTVNGPYVTVTGPSPYTNAINASQQFFRLQANY